MNLQYRGYYITVWRDSLLQSGLQYTIRRADGTVCVSSFDKNTSSIDAMVKKVKEEIDYEETQQHPWGF